MPKNDLICDSCFHKPLCLTREDLCVVYKMAECLTRISDNINEQTDSISVSSATTIRCNKYKSNKVMCDDCALTEICKYAKTPPISCAYKQTKTNAKT